MEKTSQNSFPLHIEAFIKRKYFNFIFPLVQNWSLNDQTTVKPFTILNLFYYIGRTPDVRRRNREKRNDKEHLEQARKDNFFFHSAQFFNGCCFLFAKMSSSLPMQLALLFVHVWQRSNQHKRKNYNYIKTKNIFRIDKMYLDHSKSPFAQNCRFLALLPIVLFCLFQINFPLSTPL